MGKYVTRGGHTTTCCGAVGSMNEQVKCLALNTRINVLLQEVGDTICNAQPPQSYGYGTELNYGVSYANGISAYDAFYSVHMNSGSNDPRGSEVLIYPGTTITTAIGTRVLANLANLGFVNRGIKDGTGNAEINNIHGASMIIEVCFVQASDTALYKSLGMERVARAIANGIDSRVSLQAAPTTEMHRNIIIYNTGATADQHSAEFFAMILNAHGQDCIVRDYQEYRKALVDGESIFAVGGALVGKFSYDKLFQGVDRYATAQSVLDHLKLHY